MSLLFVEGFEHVRSSTDLIRRFPEANSGVAASLPTQVGRVAGGRCLRIDNTTTAFRTAALSPGTTKVAIGFGFRCNKPANSWPQVSILNSSNVEQLSIHTISTGSNVRFRLMRGGAELYLSDTLPYDVYHYVELEAVVHSSAGTWILRIDEMTVGYGSGNTASAGGTGYSKVLFNLSTTAGVGNYVEVDDLYVRDDNLWDAVAIEGLDPISNGDKNQWTPNTGTNYAAVDDGAVGGVDDDTTYVSQSAKALDLYNFSEITSLHACRLDARIRIDSKNVGTGPGNLEIVNNEGHSGFTVLAAIFMVDGDPYATYFHTLASLNITKQFGVYADS